MFKHISNKTLAIIFTGATLAGLTGGYFGYTTYFNKQRRDTIYAARQTVQQNSNAFNNPENLPVSQNKTTRDKNVLAQIFSRHEETKFPFLDQWPYLEKIIEGDNSPDYENIIALYAIKSGLIITDKIDLARPRPDHDIFAVLEKGKPPVIYVLTNNNDLHAERITEIKNIIIGLNTNTKNITAEFTTDAPIYIFKHPTESTIYRISQDPKSTQDLPPERHRDFTP